MSIALLDPSEMTNLVNDPDYIVMEFVDSDFFVYLETTYFRDERNAEFQVLTGPTMGKYGYQISFWVRILKTKENEDYLYTATCDYYRPIQRKEFDGMLKTIREEIENKSSEWFDFSSLKHKKRSLVDG